MVAGLFFFSECFCTANQGFKDKLKQNPANQSLDAKCRCKYKV